MRVEILLEKFKKSPEGIDFVRNSRVKKPLFHATQGDFEVFDIERSDLGPHFGTIEQANYVVGSGRNRDPRNVTSGPNIRPILLDTRNPLRLKDVGCFHADCISDQLLRKGIIDKALHAEMNKEIDADWKKRKEYNRLVRGLIQKAGYDAVVYKNTHEGVGDSYIALSSQQIRNFYS